VASQPLVERSAFADTTTKDFAGVTVSVRDDLTLASLAAAKDKREALVAAIKEKYGVTLPSTPVCVEGNGIAFLWSGPDQWLAVAERTGCRDLEVELRPIVAGLAAVTDQSDARAILRISGPRAREVLAKGVPLDLHPRVFGPGSVAITHASHIGVILWQSDAAPSYELAVFRSFAQSLAEWVEDSV
jgi:heterotetrameric sarcosine oxidase gamma subunit